MRTFFRGASDLVFFLACVGLYVTASFGIALAMIITALWQRLRWTSHA